MVEAEQVGLVLLLSCGGPVHAAERSLTASYILNGSFLKSGGQPQSDLAKGFGEELHTVEELVGFFVDESLRLFAVKYAYHVSQE